MTRKQAGKATTWQRFSADFKQQTWVRAAKDGVSARMPDGGGQPA